MGITLHLYSLFLSSFLTENCLVSIKLHTQYKESPSNLEDRALLNFPSIITNKRAAYFFCCGSREGFPVSRMLKRFYKHPLKLTHCGLQ